METQRVWQATFDFFAQMPIVVEPVDAHLSTEAGLLPIRQLDEALGLTEQFAAALIDRRSGNTLTHSYPPDDPLPRLRHPGRLRGPE